MENEDVTVNQSSGNSVEENIDKNSKANEQIKADLDTESTRKNKLVIAAENEKARLASLHSKVASDYRVIGNNFYFKNQQGKLAFRDDGKKLMTSVNDERVAFALAAIAEARGWQAIKVTGSPAFRQQVWLEASLRGIKVNGYEPKEQELKELEARRERLLRNRVEKEERVKHQQPTKTEQHQIVEAVAATLIDEKTKNPATRAALKEAIAERLMERAKINNIPEVALYDKNAPATQQQTIERTTSNTERAERSR